MRRKVSIPQEEIYSWASQVWQYPEYGVPGLSYFLGRINRNGSTATDFLGAGQKVDCLLWRDEHGLVIGVLNHYPTDFPLERAGNVNVFIEPSHKRQGIGTALVAEANRRWGPINMDQQRYTPEGAAFAERLDEKARSRHP